MTDFRFIHVMDLRPGHVLVDSGEQIPFHNGDPRVVRVQKDYQLDGMRITVWFADGSACEVADDAAAETVQVLNRDSPGALGTAAQRAASGGGRF